MHGDEFLTMNYYAGEEKNTFAETYAHHLAMAGNAPGSLSHIPALAATALDQTLFIMIGRMMLRIWDDGDEYADVHFENLRDLLEKLQSGTGSSDQAFEKDPAYLFLTTADRPSMNIQPYLDAQERSDRTLNPDHRLQVHIAGAKLLGSSPAIRNV